jgi:hypothetical protein
MEADAAAKDKKIADLQDARDAAQIELADLRMSLQSAEASLAVQTAAVQRLEKQASVLMVEIRQARRSEEDWRAKGEEARSEVCAVCVCVCMCLCVHVCVCFDGGDQDVCVCVCVLQGFQRQEYIHTYMCTRICICIYVHTYVRTQVKALQIQLTSAIAKKEELQAELHDLRDRLEAKIADLMRAFADAEALAKVRVCMFVHMYVCIVHLLLCMNIIHILYV